MNKYRLSDKVRLFHYEEDGIKHSVNLRQIVALRDFADVPAGSAVSSLKSWPRALAAPTMPSPK